MGRIGRMSAINYSDNQRSILDEKQPSNDNGSDYTSTIEPISFPFSPKTKIFYAAVAAVFSLCFFLIGGKIVAKSLKRTDYLLTVGIVFAFFPFLFGLCLIFSILWLFLA